MIRAAQAKRLFIIVQAAKATGFELPAGDGLAKILYPGKRIGRAQIRAANAVIQRLTQHNCILKKGNVRRINEARLVTEKVSAEFVLLFRQLCLDAPPEYTIPEETLKQAVGAR